ncbi:hypothetical protein [Ornithinimicrobium tianjinense]|uniref:Uncharacterized protein n=1 Tax=Ornithinimicrobium tianjinense TaxID=1195761 RepID=A0A917BMC8_9MICO|nr:hypothetical protein [Ornithinimicrobium tianjinense]GGF46692.1 hypothetical protein GCM10011366_13010 [Ornithinimicrobium tianjinense]
MGGSLGEEAARVRVRRLTQDESFLLAALHLQALRRSGVSATDHVQRLGAAWHERADDYPAWVAECDDDHVGMAICRLPVLPHVGGGVPELVALEPVGQRVGPEAVALALVRSVVTWGGREGFRTVEVAPHLQLPGAVLDAARADVLGVRRVSLPTRP